MPPATEEIKDKPGFDVYAMMAILTCVFTAGATFLIYDELSRHWSYGLDRATTKKAVHLTKYNEEPEKYPGIMNASAVDREEFGLAWDANKEEMQKLGIPRELPTVKWPDGYDPLKNAVDPSGDNLKGIPDAARAALMKDYKEPSLETPKAEAPKDEPKKDPAPEAPKADAPKADAPKGDAPKTDAPKADNK